MRAPDPCQQETKWGCFSPETGSAQHGNRSTLVKTFRWKDKISRRKSKMQWGIKVYGS